ncbi:MAG: hypothetical protein CL878_03935 [Dehalococcoidia bacterium]|nr:hypothetical protein [Dehalococcoidia bacterium]
MEQTLIVVNPADEVVGYAARSKCHQGQGKRHRAITVLLFNETGKLLLQKRKSPLWDGYWDLTGATHPLHYPDHDESCEEAGARFLATEWGVRASLNRVFAFTYFARIHEACENEFCVLLAGQHQGPVQCNPDYAYDLRWSTHRAFQEGVAATPECYTPWARIVSQKLPTTAWGQRLDAIPADSSAA